MTGNLPPQYDPKATETKWQKYWEDNQTFKADPEGGGEPYCVVIPPPNVTGSLHMGHAFEETLIDVLVRYHRMTGRNTLWLPGTDHASIAVQTILEKQLKAQGKTRHDLGREKFLERAWEWKAESGNTITNQLRSLGVSVDWSRERFTMDEGLSAAVLEAFVRLYDEGLIYRGNYLVNWCPASQSAVSDLEVDQQEVEGHLWHFRYPLTDGSGYLEVATTRPETMLGDTGVAVNPEDDRYKHLIGKTVTLPIINREIPIFADELVDATFGTGCVKVTPAHDPNDFEMGKRHNLPFINIMNKDGTLNENAGEFQGQDRFVARKNVIKRLETDGVLVKIEDYKHTVPYSERGKVPVEPLLSTQWFVKIDPLSGRALEALDQNNSPVFVPERWTKVYRDWLVKLKDWCISRQLWWGHQIPAWYAISETHGEITDTTPFVVAKTEAEAREKATAKFGQDVQLARDPDVLDTWFSSGLWPFSTLGWPDETKDLDFYYPTTTLVTGFDIIFFWVARMTMMAGHFTGKMPFETVYIHGLVLDENGHKMSKSKNNGIDPLLLIAKYGTDALRYTLVKEVIGAGQNIRMEYDRKTDESKSVETSRNFTNKLWNAARFVMMNLEGQTPQQLGKPYPPQPPLAKGGSPYPPQPPLAKGGREEDSLHQDGIEGTGLELCDRWILSRYYQVVQQSRTCLENYGLGEAAKGLYEFIWGDFCDWYIELVKSRLQQDAEPNSKKVAQQTFAFVLEGILKLLHPFMPHITEEIWHTLTQTGDGDCLALQAYPEPEPSLIDPELEQQFDLLFGTIRTIRNLRADSDIKPSVKVTAILQSENEKERQILSDGGVYIQDLAKVENLTVTANLDAEPPLNPPLGKGGQGGSIAGVVGTVQVLIPLAGVVDLVALRGKLEKKLAKVEAEIKHTAARLTNQKFVDKATPDVVQGARDALAESEKQAEILRDRLKLF
ncbi:MULTISPECIES: valine--tRNA ligase [unclassified Microcoleus]|uniref:valine--tRNA ligase n=1 Tax=unclassified Microcoleus TaxID=2642155 RepID=UPI001D89588F|nr:MULTISPECIES: valine--tRNA ligase [unclassified Microcoleus]MCC3470663.1 valine--tRNA ligase [Microcoleus sp. PH2017_13_LAR_U_A]MCC3483186.1 valine--tRNA ligase [Microcoleus sp. PH2017_14_LAR_D_A]MCC3595944.1 valine--tRNA ligase [Microcoleus sp. PH2017_26_ELK_O_A]MCC3620948.1 valine--tRNA ligase [Microcoleus sp. PH2017_36_ELK_O_B]